VGGGFGARGEFYPEDFLIPFAGTPAERKQSKAIDCGFAAPGKAG
jgi:hypothetical protein